MGQRLVIDIVKDGVRLANAYYHWGAYTVPALKTCTSAIKELDDMEDFDPGALRPSADRIDAVGFKLALEERTRRFKDAEGKFDPGPDAESLAERSFASPGTWDPANAGVLTAVRMLEATGAGINEHEEHRIADRRLFPGMKFYRCVDRNAGLISVTRDGMDESMGWAEGHAVIDLDARTVSLACWFEYPDEEAWEDEATDGMPDPVPKIIDWDGPGRPDCIKFEDLEAVIGFLGKTDGSPVWVRSPIRMPDGSILEAIQ